MLNRLGKASDTYPALAVLKLGNNNISDIGATAIAEKLHFLTGLLHLDLSCNYV